jgi:hypothetical protein
VPSLTDLIMCFSISTDILEFNDQALISPEKSSSQWEKVESQESENDERARRIREACQSPEGLELINLAKLASNNKSSLSLYWYVLETTGHNI